MGEAGSLTEQQERNGAAESHRQPFRLSDPVHIPARSQFTVHRSRVGWSHAFRRLINVAPTSRIGAGSAVVVQACASTRRSRDS
jgi:hypothetical protein